MRLGAQIVGSLEKGLRDEFRRMQREIPDGVKAAGEGLKGDLRKQVVISGLGMRLSRTWRAKVYGNDGDDAAALVYTRAPQIIRAHGEGATIRPRSGRFLAIPLDGAPKRGPGGKKVTPAVVEGMFGRPLRYVRRRGGNPILVMDGAVARGGKRGGFRAATVRQTKRRGAHVSLRGLTTVAMFVLVRQVRLRKRFDVERAAREWSGRLPGLIREQLLRRR